MLSAYGRSGDSNYRIEEGPEERSLAGSNLGREGRCVPSRSRVLLIIFLVGVLVSGMAPMGYGADLKFGSDLLGTTSQDYHLWLVSSARTAGVHGRGDAIDLHSLIEEVRFNEKALSFDQGVTVGPDPGSLEIQFAAPVSGVADSLRYRLLGVDTEWKEVGKERAVLYEHLKPGKYEFDFQQTISSGSRGSTVAGLPVTVVPPYWQTPLFRTVSVFTLLLVILGLYKLRVGFLQRRVRKLQEEVTQTKAELTLAAKVAGDAQEALKEQALKDALTGLWNRRAIFAMLEREVCRAQRDRFPITLVMLDLDHFKKINDTHGHLTGDEVLREVASRLTDVMRPYDFAGRYGGEEFLVVLPSCSPHNGIQRAEEFRRAIAQRPAPTAIGPLPITCSLGVAAYDESMPPEELIHRADEALYRAKRFGRNCVVAAEHAALANRR